MKGYIKMLNWKNIRKTSVLIVLTLTFVGCKSVQISSDPNIREQQVNLAAKLNDYSGYPVENIRQDNGFTFISTVSGGGYRAGSFALGYLLALDSIKHDESKSFLDELDFISTVSGGGMAVAAAMTIIVNDRRCKSNDSAPSVSLVKLFASSEGRSKIDRMREAWGKYFARGLFDVRLLKKSYNKTDKFRTKYVDRLLSKWNCVEGKGSKWTPYTLGEIEKAAFEYRLPLHVSNATVSTSGYVLPFYSGLLEHLGYNCFATSHGWVKARSDKFPYSVGVIASAAFPPLWSDVRIGVDRSLDNEGVNSVDGKCKNPKFTHLTDGGQSDDNGFYIALDYLSKINRDVDLGKKKTLFVTVDALNSQDALTVEQESTANILEVYLNRNHNLPRYGLKREFRDEFSEPDESVRSLLEGSVSGQSVYAAHVNLLEEFQEGAGHSTFDTGTGISMEQQIKTISEGMLQTYRALINRWDTKEKENDLTQKVTHIVYLMMCSGRTKNKSINQCEKYKNNSIKISDSDLDKAWTEFVEYININAKKGKDKLITFERAKKTSEWNNTILSLGTKKTEYIKSISSEANTKVTEVEKNKEEEFNAINTRYSAMKAKSSEELIDDSFNLFYGAAWETYTEIATGSTSAFDKNRSNVYDYIDVNESDIDKIINFTQSMKDEINNFIPLLSDKANNKKDIEDVVKQKTMREDKLNELMDTNEQLVQNIKDLNEDLELLEANTDSQVKIEQQVDIPIEQIEKFKEKLDIFLDDNQQASANYDELILLSSEVESVLDGIRESNDNPVIAYLKKIISPLSGTVSLSGLLEKLNQNRIDIDENEKILDGINKELETLESVRSEYSSKLCSTCIGGNCSLLIGGDTDYLRLSSSDSRAKDHCIDERDVDRLDKMLGGISFQYKSAVSVENISIKRGDAYMMGEYSKLKCTASSTFGEEFIEKQDNYLKITSPVCFPTEIHMVNVPELMKDVDDYKNTIQEQSRLNGKSCNAIKRAYGNLSRLLEFTIGENKVDLSISNLIKGHIDRSNNTACEVLTGLSVSPSVNETEDKTFAYTYGKFNELLNDLQSYVGKVERLDNKRDKEIDEETEKAQRKIVELRHESDQIINNAEKHLNILSEELIQKRNAPFNVESKVQTDSVSNTLEDEDIGFLLRARDSHCTTVSTYLANDLDSLTKLRGSDNLKAYQINCSREPGGHSNSNQEVVLAPEDECVVYGDDFKVKSICEYINVNNQLLNRISTLPSLTTRKTHALGILNPQK